MPKKPEAYKMKTRSRDGMLAAIAEMTTVHFDYTPYSICFNVKCYSVDLTLSDMLKRWREQEDDPAYTHSPEWLRAVKKRYSEVKQHLWEWGVEDARAQFVGYDNGLDTFCTLYDGTQVDVEYAFIGRSGGWLAITKFNGHHFNRPDTSLEECLANMDYSDLKKLYQLVLMLKHDLRPEAVKNEIEFQATFNFFANACAAIPQPDAIQGELFDTATEEEILADAEERHPL